MARRAGDVLVVGGGRFGRLAVARLGSRVRAVAEPAPGAELLVLGVKILRQEGAAALHQALTKPDPPEWIVPALPRHLLVDWLTAWRLPQARLLPLPEALLPETAWRLAAAGHGFYLSLADFACPSDCPEPAGVCTSTGRPRGRDLWARLADMAAPGWRAGVLRSHQLAPGVGGLRRGELMELARRVAETGGAWMLATACRCHAVAHGIEITTA